MIRRVSARFWQVAGLGLAWIASFSPRVAFITSDALAALFAITSSTFTRAELRSLFPHLSSEEVVRTLRRIWKTRARTRYLGHWIRRSGIAPIRELVRESEAVRQLRPPLIVSTFHVGPMLALRVLPELLQGETLTLRCGKFSIDGTSENVEFTDGPEQKRAATFHRAIDHLRRGGFVITAFDPGEGNWIAAPFLGRTLRLARGAFALSRIARVPIVPVVARWDGDEIEILIGDPLPVLGDEQALAASATRWLEDYLRDSPGELSARILELMREE